jgi:hypothetical protein
MGIVKLIIDLVHLFYQQGAHHVYGTKQAGNGLVVTKNYLVLACRIPAHLHGTFRCSGWVHRP